MTIEETVKQYAADQITECGWDRKELNIRLSRNTLTQIANGDPKDILDKLVKLCEIRAAMEHIILGREAMERQYGELWQKRNAW